MGQECSLPDPDKDSCEKSGDPPGCASTPAAGNPIFVGSGTKIETVVDYDGSQGFRFARTYRSNRVASGPTGFAGGMFSNFHMRLVLNQQLNRIYAYRSDGSVLVFNIVGGAIQGDADIADRITQRLDGNGDPDGWTYYRASDEDTETYDVDGRLISILHRDGQLVRITYRGYTGEAYPDGWPTCSTTPPDFVINGTSAPWCVTDATGRQLNFGYDENGFLVELVDPAGQSILYEYNGPTAPYPNTAGSTLALLTKVTYPNLSVRTYHYDEPAYSNASIHGLLTGITDENGVRYATFSYDAAGNAIETWHATNVNRYQLSSAGSGSVAVTDPLGTTRTYGFTTLLGAQRNTTITEPLPGGGSVTQTLGYDANGNISDKTDFDGTTSTYGYDLARNLQTNRVEVSNAAGPDSPKRTTQTDWHATHRVPVERRTYNASSILEAVSRWTYNTRSQATARCDIDPDDPAAVAYTCSATTAPPSGARVRRSVTTYCEQADVTAGTCPLIGLVTSVNGPRLTSDPGMGGVDDITTYTYYQIDDPTCASDGACPHRHGDLWKIINAQGHVTEYVTYDKNGRATRIKDANGTITDFTYHPRGWLINRIVRAKADGTPLPIADAALHLDYDGVGNVTKVIQPNGSYLAYTYDDAHRLIKITDNLDNTIDYCPGGVGSADCLDAAGNRLIEQIKDSNDTIQHTVRRQYDQLSRLQKVLNAASQATFDATDGYDGNGNLTASTDGLGVVTEQTYDPLDRLIETLQDVGGTDPATADTGTTYAYDARDNLRQVTDPDGLNTVYDYDGLNNLTGLHSPDTGDTTYTYDHAGNRTSQTDNRGVTSTYTYDALNRLTGIAYPTASLDVTYAYDQSNAVTGCTGSYPLGRLTRMTDASGSTTYCYDRRGNVKRKTQVTGGQTLATGYTYTLADKLASIAYPSGAIVAYDRDAVGRVTAVTWRVNGMGRPTILVDTATWYPFGPLHGLTFGNGRTLTKTYDGDYAIDSIAGTPAGALTLDYSLDVMGNLTSASDTLNPLAPDRVYAYDPLYRLTTAQTGAVPPAPLEQYTYGPTGDRLSAALNGGVPVAYDYAAGSHHLADVGGTARSYDANGNTLTGTALGGTLAYDDRNRLASATRTGIHANYLFNGRGERVEKTVYTGIGGIGSQRTTRYAYDEGGRLLGEYGATGAALAEYVYLDATPIAVVKDATPYYIETDHLGTPRQVIDPARNVAVWTWDLLGSTFGANAPDEDPDGDSTAFEMGLRFPGQYYDAETGLSYNYFRDYEPATGRYIESDPIGIYIDINTYSYTNGNPINWGDFYGLWKYYGNWCGPDWTGGVTGQYTTESSYWYKEPIDRLDRACRNHDVCYHNCRSQHPCDGSDRGSCMTRCDRVLAHFAEMSGHKRSSPLWWWMNNNNSPDPGPDSPYCGCKAQQ